MICLHCGQDRKYKERPGRKCLCGKSFAFEPRDGDPITDKAFQAAIDRVSGGGKIRFGVENLYYEVARRLRRKPWWGCAVALGVIVGIGLLIAGQAWLSLAFAVGAAAAALLLKFTFQESPLINLSKPEFEGLWKKWVEAKGLPEAVIQRPDAPAPPRPKEADLGDYSFDRAVICDRARTVDLLLANNFHFENNCAVLAYNGYPKHAFDLVKKMLLRNPKLQVFVLHDATPEGCRLAENLSKDPQWFKGRAKVVDVGLRPGQAKGLRKLYLESQGTVTEGPGVTEAEAAWLSKYVAELAAVRPEQLLRHLFRAINKHKAPDSDSGAVVVGGDGGGGGGGVDYDESISTPAEAADGGDADGFG